jgi:hypothetical protein
MDTIFSKSLIALVQGRGSTFSAIEKARAEGHEDVARDLGRREKAAVAGGTLSSLSTPTLAGREFWELVQTASVFGRVAALARRAPWRTPTPREADGGAGAAWRGEGLASPAFSAITDQVNLEFTAIDAIFVVTREVARFGITGEAAIRKVATAAIVQFLDHQLLDPSVSATSARPASLTYGAEVVTPSGTAAANVAADLASMASAIHSSGTAMRWICSPLTFIKIASKLAGLGLAVTPDNLLGTECLLGSAAPSNQIALVDCGQVVVAHDDAVDVDVSFVTSLEMTDAPSADAGTGAGAAAAVALWQAGALAVKASLAANWAHLEFNGGSPDQPAGVAVMTLNF